MTCHYRNNEAKAKVKNIQVELSLYTDIAAEDQGDVHTEHDLQGLLRGCIQITSLIERKHWKTPVF